MELSHILILIDDPERTVLEPLNARAEELRKLYDFDLMQGGGHLAGWLVDGEERRAGKERRRGGRARWVPAHLKKKKEIYKSHPVRARA